MTRKRSTIQAGASQVRGKVWQGSLGYGAPWLLIGSFQMTREASRIIKKRTVQGQSECFLDPHRAPELSGTFDPPLASSTLVFLFGRCPISRLNRGSVPIGLQWSVLQSADPASAVLPYTTVPSPRQALPRPVSSASLASVFLCLCCGDPSYSVL